MADPITGALIGAGASLLGGIFGKKQRNKELAMQDPVYIRKRLEEAGLNPATHYGAAASSMGLNYAPQMGAAFADAGAMIASGFDRSQQLQIQNTRLAMEREKLDAVLKQVSLRPQTAGIYGKNTGRADASLQPKTPFIMEKAETEPVKNIPLTSVSRTGMGGQEWTTLNPNAFEIGVGEILGGVIIHGGAWGVNQGKKFYDFFNDYTYKPTSRRGSSSLNSQPLFPKGSTTVSVGSRSRVWNQKPPAATQVTRMKMPSSPWQSSTLTRAQ